MLLTGPVRLEALQYEFPGEATGSDADWLFICVRVKTPQGNWTARDACLETQDVSEIAEWLHALAAGEPADRELEFLEPNLAFEVLSRRPGWVALRIWFELELRPEWAPWDDVPSRDLSCDVEATPEDLREAAMSLRHDLERFPARSWEG